MPAKYKISADELRKKDINELMKLLNEQRAELASLRHKAVAGSIDSPAKIRELRKNIARILTIIREKKSQPPQQTEGQGEKSSS
ncbi:MAG: 50S ribosomal protein L29 [Acidilobus sp.]